MMNQYTIEEARGHLGTKNELPLARAILLAALTGVDDWRYNSHFMWFEFRWTYYCNGTRVHLSQIISLEALKSTAMDIMTFAEYHEYHALQEWIHYRYHGPRT
jgi:hypothetical protein